MELGLVSLRDEHVDNPKEDADGRCSITRQPAGQIRHWNVQPIGEPPRSADKVRRANQRGPVRVIRFRHRAAINPQRWRLRYRALALVLSTSRTLRPLRLRKQVQGFQQNMIGHWNRTIQETLKQRGGNAEPSGGLLLAPKYRR
jgi:hypothetical protein